MQRLVSNKTFDVVDAVDDDRRRRDRKRDLRFLRVLCWSGGHLHESSGALEVARRTLREIAEDSRCGHGALVLVLREHGSALGELCEALGEEKARARSGG
jgi:hypothetical protein